MHRFTRSTEASRLLRADVSAGPAWGGLGHTHQSAAGVRDLRLSCPKRVPQSPSVLAMMFFWISEVPP